MHEPLLGFRTISRGKLSPLEQTTQQQGHQNPTPTFNNNLGWAYHLNSTLPTQWVKKLSTTATQRWTPPTPQPLLGLSSKPQPNMNNAAKRNASRSP